MAKKEDLKTKNLNGKLNLNYSMRGVKSVLMNPKQIFRIALTITGIVLLAVSYKQISTYRESKREIKALSINLVNLKTKEDSLNDLLALTAQIDSNLEIAAQALPYDSQIPAFMTQIETAAKNSGLAVERLSFARSLEKSPKNAKKEEGKNADEYKKIGIRGGFKGSYLQIQKFLEKIENARRLTRIVSLQTSSVKTKENPLNTLSLTITFEGYYMPRITKEKASSLQNKADFRDANLVETLNTISKIDLYDKSSYHQTFPKAPEKEKEAKESSSESDGATGEEEIITF